MISTRFIAAVIATLPIVDAAHAADQPLRLSPVPIQKVAVDDPFWNPKFEVWRTVTIPDCLAKFEHDGVLTNFDHITRSELKAPR